MLHVFRVDSSNAYTSVEIFDPFLRYGHIKMCNYSTSPKLRIAGLSVKGDHVCNCLPHKEVTTISN